MGKKRSVAQLSVDSLQAGFVVIDGVLCLTIFTRYQGLKNGFFVSSMTTAVGSRTSANCRMDKIMDTLFVI